MGCATPATIIEPSQVPTVAPPSLTPTNTPVWFPATATPTLFPTPSPQAPTPNPRSGLAMLIYEDTFSDPEVWSSLSVAQGSATFGKNELTLIAQAKRVYVSSLRLEPQLNNFFAEINANPVFCRDQDEYGILVRAVSPANYYRFSVSCNSQTRLDRIVDGQAASLVTWQFSQAIPPGGPSRSRLQVWAYGQRMRFFANDELLFEVRDPKLAAGGLGVFIRSASDEILTVNFTELSVFALQPVAETPTPTLIPGTRYTPSP